MVNALVFHIGDQKAGSTSIQKTFGAKGVKSPDVSYFYPGKTNHTNLARTFTDKHKFQSRIAKFEALRDRMDKSDADVGIISSERFEWSSPQDLHDVLQKTMPHYMKKLQIVVYIRPHVDRLVSTWAQRVKRNYQGTLEDFYESYKDRSRLNYISRLDQWLAVFGNTLIVRPMVRKELFQESAVSDFAQICLGTDNFSVSEKTANESLSLEELSLFRLFHLKQIDGEMHPGWTAPASIGMARKLAKIKSQIGGTKPQIHETLLKKMQDVCLADAKEMDERFFSGTPMLDALNSAKSISVAQSIRAEDHFPDWELRMYEAMSELVRDLSGVSSKAPEKLTVHLNRQNLGKGIKQ